MAACLLHQSGGEPTEQGSAGRLDNFGEARSCVETRLRMVALPGGSRGRAEKGTPACEWRSSGAPDLGLEAADRRQQKAAVGGAAQSTGSGGEEQRRRRKRSATRISGGRRRGLCRSTDLGGGDDHRWLGESLGGSRGRWFRRVFLMVVLGQQRSSGRRHEVEQRRR